MIRNGWEGLPEIAPFDVIHVGAAAAKIPSALLAQLKLEGVMIVPVGPDGGHQSLYLVKRIKEEPTLHSSHFESVELMGVRYVPLVP